MGGPRKGRGSSISIVLKYSKGAMTQLMITQYLWLSFSLVCRDLSGWMDTLIHSLSPYQYLTLSICC